MKPTPEEKSSTTKPQIKLLIVDDKEENLFSIEAILEKDGYVITKANSGKAALKILLKEFDFSLILMDVQMPDLNGFDTANLIYQREKLKHIPIIFITANDHQEESVFKGYQMGGVDYLYKPINPELLRAKVGVFVDLYYKKHQLLQQEQKLIFANKKLEREIEERKMSESKISMLNKQLMDNIFQLKATNEELERFAYIASHDLQEPLRKIILFGDRLGEKFSGPLGNEGLNYLQRMMNATERMQLLIKNILAFSRSSTNTDSFAKTSLNTLIDGVISDLEVYIEQKKAIFNVGPLPSLWIIPSQFRQVFQNLFINALKFSKEHESPIITVYAEIVKGLNIPEISAENYNEDYCQIYIQDNGIGFEQKYAEQIFMIFKRLHSHDQFEGTGIGLSICKKVVEKHNGLITVNSKPDEGSTFIITLPMKMPEKQLTI